LVVACKKYALPCHKCHAYSTYVFKYDLKIWDRGSEKVLNVHRNNECDIFVFKSNSSRWMKCIHEW
jgi:hypothetical protein